MPGTQLYTPGIHRADIAVEAVMADISFLTAYRGSDNFFLSDKLSFLENEWFGFFRLRRAAAEAAVMPMIYRFYAPYCFLIYVLL